MGGRPLALVDTLVSPDREHAERVLDGLAWAAELLGVRVVGGHLTLGGAPALSAFCTGVATRAAARRRPRARATRCSPPSASRASTAARRPIFSSLRDRARPSGCATTARRSSRSPRAGSATPRATSRCRASPARCCSCSSSPAAARRSTSTALPRPAGVPLERWLVTFPSFGFVLAAAPERGEAACEPFRARGLAAARCGAFDDTARAAPPAGGAEAKVWDLAREPLTGLGRLTAAAARAGCPSAGARRRGTGRDPAARRQPSRSKKRDVGQLDHRHHPLAAELAGGAHGEAHERGAEQAVAEPAAAPRAGRPSTAAGRRAGRAARRRRSRRRPAPTACSVAGSSSRSSRSSPANSLLLVDEHRAAHGEVALELVADARDAAGASRDGG